MRLLVFGRTGQVARELRRYCPPGWEMTTLGRAEAELSRPGACAAAIHAARADAIINAAAFTAVDRAEEEEALALRINGEAPAEMARAAAQAGLPFLHLSTDYVFDGTGDRPWRPDDASAPLGAYGRTKSAGEQGIRAAGGTHVILRTSWVFSAHGANFVRTMLRLGQERGAVRVVGDQIGGPTAAADIAGALLKIASWLQGDDARTGTHHFAGLPDTSWAGFAREIFAQAGMAVPVEEIATADYPTPAARPANSRLDCSDLLTEFGIPRPDWRQSLGRVLQELGER